MSGQTLAWVLPAVGATMFVLGAVIGFLVGIHLMAEAIENEHR